MVDDHGEVAGSDDAGMMPVLSSGVLPEHANPIGQLNGILDEWIASRGTGQDPVVILTRLCELVEHETAIYHKMDPDPFDDRHPSRTKPNAALGGLLKALFQNDEFMETLVSTYIASRDNRKLSEVACRLLYDILPGLEASIVFEETEGIVARLYHWAEHAENPLKSYAIGLLGAAMDVQDIAVNWREQNAALIPILLDELHELAALPSEVPPERKLLFLEQPFAQIGDTKSKCVLQACESKDRNRWHQSGVRTPSSSRKRKREDTLSVGISKGTSVSRCAGESSSSEICTPPVHSSLVNECSNSSWAEMELLTIGHYQIYPLSVETRQRFILQYLTPLGEYIEFLSVVIEKNVLQLILRYINLKQNHDVRLAFEALCYLASLLCHKKFSMEFLKAGGLLRLLEVYRPSVAATGVSICLYYLSYSEAAMETLCQQPPHVLTELIRYVLWLLERSHESSRSNAIMFLGLAFMYPRLLDHFDSEDGLRRLVNVVSTLDVLTDPGMLVVDRGGNADNEDKIFASMQTARHVCYSLRKYFEAHLVLKAEQLRRMAAGESSSQSSLNVVPFLPTSTALVSGGSGCKPLRLKADDVEETMAFVMNALPSKAHWPAVDQFIALGGLQLMLRLVLITHDDSPVTAAAGGNGAGRAETMRSALEVIAVCTLLPRAQLVFSEVVEHPVPDSDMDGDAAGSRQVTNGVSTVLDILSNAGGVSGAGIGGTDSHYPFAFPGFTGGAESQAATADMQKAALQIVINCVCGPVRRPLQQQQFVSNGWLSSSVEGQPSISNRVGDYQASAGNLDTFPVATKMFVTSVGSGGTPLSAIATVSSALSTGMGTATLQLGQPSETTSSVTGEARVADIGGVRNSTNGVNNIMNMNNTPSTNPSRATRIPKGGGEREVLYRMWRCVRSHNGIMVLLSRLAVKVPITQADAIRALACRALCGLARCPTVKQIMSKLPIFTRGQLEVLTREPVLQDNSALHARFKTHAAHLTELVTGIARGPNDILQRQSGRCRLGDELSLAWSDTPIREIKYRPNDLLVLMYEHLLGAGLVESAHTLLREARLADLLTTRRQLPSVITPSNSMPASVTGTAVSVLGISAIRSKLSASVNHRCSTAGDGSSSPQTSPPVTCSTPKIISLSRGRSAMIGGDSAGNPCGSSQRRAVKPLLSLAEKSEQRDTLSPAVRRASAMASAAASTFSLDRLVRDYLAMQHANCNFPVDTCPPFQLLSPHRCEEPVLKSRAPTSIVQRLAKRQAGWPLGGWQGGKLTRKYIYSKFKPVRTFRDVDVPGKFTCCSFSACDELLFVGNTAGELKVFNVLTGTNEATYTCHTDDLTNCQPSKDGKLILTSSFIRQPLSVLWTFTDLFQQKIAFKDDSYVEFGKLYDDRILGTQSSTAHLYDTVTGRKISTFIDQKLSNEYLKNRATFNLTDELILNDGVLWDVRRVQPVHKFDKFNPYINGVFTPNGLEVISNTEVWDLRTFKLLHTLSALNQCQVLFNSRGNVIYGAMIQCEELDSEYDPQLQSMYGNSFKTIDATDYSNIATIDIKRTIFDMGIDRRDMYIAIVESSGDRSQGSQGNGDSVAKLYEIGRQKVEDGVDDNEQDDDNVDSEDVSSSSTADIFHDPLDDFAEDGDYMLDGEDSADESDNTTFDGDTENEASSDDDDGGGDADDDAESD